MADEGPLSVAVGGSLSGNIDFNGDTDDIRVFLVSGQTYVISLRGTGSTALHNSFLEVYNPSAALVNFDDDGGIGTNSLLTFTATATGNYTIRASSFSDPNDPGTGQWTVDVRVQGVDAVGDTNATAVVMGLGTTFGFRETATVSGGADLDRYEVQLEAGHFYTFNLAAGADYATDYTAVPAGEIDTILRLRNAAGTLVAQNDDNNFPTDVSSGFGFLAQTSGTYYLDVTGYAGQTGGYVVDRQDIDYHNRNPLEAINWDRAHNIDTVTVAGTPTAYVYFGTAGETFGEPGLVTFGWNAKEKAAVMSALLEITKITGITYLETTDVNQAEFRLNTVSTGNFGAYFNPQDPAFGSQQGIGIFNVNSGGWDKPGVSTQDIPGDQVSLDKGGFAYATLLRYFAQAHGLASPHNNEGGSEIMLGVTAPTNSYGLFELNQGVFTIMSFNDAWDFHPDGPSPFTIAGIGNGWSGTLGAFDIAVLQERYGVHAFAEGDTVYTIPSVQQSGVYYQTIWDTGGNDLIIYNGTGRATIDLTAATLDYSPTGGGVMSFVDQIPGTAGVDGIFGGFTIANGVVIENATGGSGNDTLSGNSADNRLDGRGGNDTLTGRGGNDTFVFAPGYGPDRIIDFVVGGTEDKVDLRAFANIRSLADLLAISTQQGANTVIDFGGGDTLRLDNVVRTDLRRSDFLLPGQETRFDFDGDGKGDILLQNSDGTPTVWLLDGVNVKQAGVALANPGPSWHAIDSADFNGDGKADILWQNDNGTPAVWLMNGTNVLSTGPALSNPGPSWKVKEAADFDGDGKADILWQNADGTAGVWLMDGTSVASKGGGLNPGGPGWHVQDAADFNGDGKADILWQNDNGLTGVWLMNGTSVLQTGGALPGTDASWHAQAAADFDGDGKADILWQNDSGAARVWLMDGTTVLSQGAALANPGPTWHVKEAVDANGDGNADILWQNDNGTPGVWLMNGTSVLQTGGALQNPGAAWHIV